MESAYLSAEWFGLSGPGEDMILFRPVAAEDCRSSFCQCSPYRGQPRQDLYYVTKSPGFFKYIRFLVQNSNMFAVKWFIFSSNHSMKARQLEGHFYEETLLSYNLEHFSNI